jgi:hypothetical protein
VPSVSILNPDNHARLELHRLSPRIDRNLPRHLEDEAALIIPLILERFRDDPNFR